MAYSRSPFWTPRRMHPRSALVASLQELTVMSNEYLTCREDWISPVLYSQTSILKLQASSLISVSSEIFMKLQVDVMLTLLITTSQVHQHSKPLSSPKFFFSLDRHLGTDVCPGLRVVPNWTYKGFLRGWTHAFSCFSSFNDLAMKNCYPVAFNRPHSLFLYSLVEL